MRSRSRSLSSCWRASPASSVPASPAAGEPDNHLDSRKAPLVEAVKRGDAAAVRALLARRLASTSTPPQPMARRRCTGPSSATTRRHDGTTAAAGANVRATNRYGVTPLSLAAVNGNAAIVERLLEGRRRSERRVAGRRDGADDRGAHRPGRRGARAARPRRGRERARQPARADGADVGGGAKQRRCRAGARGRGADLRARTTRAAPAQPANPASTASQALVTNFEGGQSLFSSAAAHRLYRVPVRRAHRAASRPSGRCSTPAPT